MLGTSPRRVISRLAHWALGLAAILLVPPASVQAQLGKVPMGIGVAKADGSQARLLARVADRYHHGSPNWSSDGRYLLFDAYRQDLKDPVLFRVDRDGEQVTELGSGAYPSWSPDGKQILFFSGLGSNPVVSLMSADGTERREIFYGAWPSWSPDGKRIVFVRYGVESGIWVADANGSNQQLLFPYQDAIFAPVWSPDDQLIAFSSRAAGTFDIYTIRTDGSDLRQLTSEAAMDLLPNWSPDSRQITFTRYQDDQADVYVINRDGGDAQVIVFGPGFDIDPAWSPDGEWIAFGTQMEIEPSDAK